MATHPPSEKPSKVDERLTRAPGRFMNASNADSLVLPTHAQHSDSDSVEPGPESHFTTSPRAAWKRFNGYGRKKVGFFDSVKAVVFSSCVFTPSFSVVIAIHIKSPRLERAVDFSSVRLGFPLQTLEPRQDFCTCVPSLGSKSLIRLLIEVRVFGSVCFLSIIPLERLFDWCGEQMTLYLGLTLGDLLAITLNNAVEATLAIILLLKCE